MGVTIKLKKKGTSRKGDKAQGRARADYEYTQKQWDKDEANKGATAPSPHESLKPKAPSTVPNKRSAKFARRRTRKNERQTGLSRAVSAGVTPKGYYSSRKTKKKWDANEAQYHPKGTKKRVIRRKVNA